MTNVSKQSLDDQAKTKIENTFANFLGSLSADTVADFYTSFFTESEQVMFTKRLAVIIMLEKGAAYAHIATVLKVSPSTVSRLNRWRENGRFDEFIALIEDGDDSFADRIWTAIRILIEENVHHYGASGWRWLDRTDAELNQ